MPSANTVNLNSRQIAAGLENALGQIDQLDQHGSIVGSWQLQSPRCTIGSSIESTISLTDDGVAPVHATLTFGKRYTLLKSIAQPTCIGGRSVREWLIDSPTTVQIGSTFLVVYPCNAAATVLVRGNEIDRCASKMRTPLETQIQVSMQAPLQEPANEPVLPSENVAASPSMELLEELRTSLQALQATVESNYPKLHADVNEYVNAQFSEFGKRWFTDLKSELSRGRDEQSTSVAEVAQMIQARIEQLDERIRSITESVHRDSSDLRELLLQTQTDQQRIQERIDEVASANHDVIAVVNQLQAGFNELEALATTQIRTTSQPLQDEAYFNAPTEVPKSVASYDAPAPIPEALPYAWHQPNNAQIDPPHPAERLDQSEFDPSDAPDIDLYHDVDQTPSGIQSESPVQDSGRPQLPAWFVNESPDAPMASYGETQVDSHESYRQESAFSDEYHYAEPMQRLNDQPDDASEMFRHPDFDPSADRSAEADDMQGAGYPAFEEQSHQQPSEAQESSYEQQSYEQQGYQPQAYQQQSYVSQYHEPRFDEQPANESAQDGDRPSYSHAHAAQSTPQPKTAHFSDQTQSDPQVSHPLPVENDDSSPDEESIAARLERLLSEATERKQKRPNESRPSSTPRFSPEKLSQRFSEQAKPIAPARSVADVESDERDAESIYNNLPESDDVSASIMDSIAAAQQPHSFDGQDDYSPAESEPDHAEVVDSYENESELNASAPVEETPNDPVEETPPEPAPHSHANSHSHSHGEDAEESIEEYMQRLLQRVRGGPGGEPAPSANRPSPVLPAPPKPVLPKPSIQQADPLNPTLDSSQRSQIITENNLGRDSARIMTSRQAPEAKTDLEALRELANSNARRAINRSDQRRKSSASLIKFAVSALAMACALSLYSLNGTRLNAPFVGMIAALVVSLLWGYDCVVQLFHLSRNKRRNDLLSAEAIQGGSRTMAK